MSANLQHQNGKHAQNSFVHHMRYAPLTLKTELLEENWEAVKEGLRKALEPDAKPFCPKCGRDGHAHPWAIRAMLEVAGAVGPQVMANLFAIVGVSGPEELTEYVKAGKRLKSASEGDIDLERTYQVACETLEMLIREQPSLKERVTARFGSGAEVVP